MPIKILAFAQAADRLGFREREAECAPGDSVRAILLREAPGAELSTFRVALDHEYADWDSQVGAAREIAIIPPVSGG